MSKNWLDGTLTVVTFPENGVRVAELVEAVQVVSSGEDGRSASSGPSMMVVPASSDEQDPVPPLPDSPPVGAGGLLDALTGVLRSDRLMPAMSKYIAGLRRDGEPVSLISFDVDQLRNYNEHYGQETGDDILRTIGAVLQRNVREDDLIGRAGGQEFVLLLPCGVEHAFGRCTARGLVHSQGADTDNQRSYPCYGQWWCGRGTHARTHGKAAIGGGSDRTR